MTHSVSESEDANQGEFASVKFLLKQVYAAHVTKVKDLETEVRNLKQELNNKEKSLSECQKCKEMEGAYNACKEEYKKAVLEQTRRLREIELKFSVIDKKNETKNSELDDSVEHSSPRISVSEPVTDACSGSLAFTELENVDVNFVKKVDVHTVRKNSYAKKLDQSLSNMHGTLLQENVSASPTLLIGFNDKKELLSHVRSSSGSNKNESVLVPDSLDILCSPSKTHNKINKNEIHSPKKQNNDKENKANDKETEKLQPPKPSDSKKRALSDMSPDKKKLNRKSSHDKNSVTRNLTSTPVEEVTSSSVNKKKKILKEPVPWSENFKDFNYKSVSPTLIQRNKDNLQISDDDFESSDIPAEDSRPWKTSVKNKHSQKKQIITKTIKTTSRFKMVLEPLNENCKRPNYKQVTLSQSIFKPNKKSKEDLFDKGDAEKSVIICEPKVSHCPEISRPSHETSVAGLSELASLIDVDVTRNQHKSSTAMNIGTFSFDVSEVVCPPNSEDSNPDVAVNADGKLTEDEPSEDEDTKQEDQNDDKNIKIECDSFDRVPAAEEPNYKYKEETVRNKSKRKQLQGFECKDCEKYYKELGLSEEEKKERLKQCSKHRAKYVPPSTPEHFWELDFPDTEECKVRGYMAETQKVQLKSRRRRPLE